MVRGGRRGRATAIVVSAPAKVRRVALVRPDDPAYLAAMSAQALAHRRLGPRQDPGDIYRASGLVEAAVRGWLGQRVPLLAERDRKSTRLNSSHIQKSRMPSSA